MIQQGNEKLLISEFWAKEEAERELEKLNTAMYNAVCPIAQAPCYGEQCQFCSPGYVRNEDILWKVEGPKCAIQAFFLRNLS